MLQDVNQVAEGLQALQLDEGGPQGIVQDCAQRVHQGRQHTPVAICLREELVVQLVLHLAHLRSRSSSVTVVDLSPMQLMRERSQGKELTI